MLENPASLYRTIWRWHFFAGLAVMPFLVILALTGAIYLFNDEINDVLHAKKRFAASTAGTALVHSRLVEAALANYPGGKVTRIDTPRSPDRTVEFFVTPESGEPRRVFVDPRSGAVLGSYVYNRTLVGFADVVHGSLLFGDVGDAIVELAACWGFILIITGLYLWWPRSGKSLIAYLWPRFELEGRRFWKSLHASVGLWTAFLALFLILSGLPWATIWGGGLRTLLETAGIGYPSSYRTHGTPGSPGTPKPAKEQSGDKPWTLEDMPEPESRGGHAAHAVPTHSVETPAVVGIGIDEVAAILARHGMSDPYRLSMPVGPSGVYAAVVYPDQPEGQRTLYIDQYSGEVLRDVKFGDYGWGAKAVELGVQIHMGNYFGRVNQIAMLIPCIGILLLAITGPYMWWTRRPKGALGAPQAYAASYPRGMLATIATLGVLFPMAGASIFVVLILDATMTAWGGSVGSRQR